VNDVGAGEFDFDQAYVACGGLEVTPAPDGCVVYDAAAEKVHYLNPTAGVVFELCDGAKSARAIGAFLKSAYELDAEPLDSVRDCLVSLCDQGLVRPCATSSAAP
jgi:hypothetical protein